MKGSGLIQMAGRALHALAGFTGSQRDEASTPIVSPMYGVRNKASSNNRRSKFKRRTRGRMGRRKVKTWKSWTAHRARRWK